MHQPFEKELTLITASSGPAKSRNEGDFIAAP